jgi:hypothetical protein
MSPKLTQLRAVLSIAVISIAAGIATAQTVMDNAAIIKLNASGLSEDIIVQTINASAGQYDTSTDGLIALKKAGVTDKEVSAIISKAANPNGPAPVAVAANPTQAWNPQDSAPSNDQSGPLILGKVIPKGSTVFIAPMNGFETYLISALDKKQVPLTVVNDRSKATFEITGNADSEKAGWAKTIVTGSSRSTEEASINVTAIKSGAIVFAYNVNKSNSVHGKQSTAEACAKHLKEKIDSGK